MYHALVFQITPFCNYKVYDPCEHEKSHWRKFQKSKNICLSHWFWFHKTKIKNECLIKIKFRACSFFLIKYMLVIGLAYTRTLKEIIITALRNRYFSLTIRIWTFLISYCDARVLIHLGDNPRWWLWKIFIL